MSVKIVPSKGSTVEGMTAQQWGKAGDVQVQVGGQVAVFIPSASVEIPPDGYPLVTSWNTVRGATKVVVDDGGAGTAQAPPAGSVRISAAGVLRPLGDISTSHTNSGHVYTNGQRKRIRKLTLRGLKRTGDDNPVYRNAGDFGTATTDGKLMRLIVSTRASGSDPWMPVFAIPQVDQQKALPAMLTGATFTSEVLTFPYALTGQIRLALHEKKALNEADVFDSNLASIAATEEVLPLDLELSGPAGQVVWAFPGEYLPGSPAAEPSLRVPLELALNEDLPAALAGGRPLRAEFKLKGKAEGEAAFITFTPVRGAVLREHKGLLHCDLAGDPVPLPLGEPLDSAAPESVKGGLSIRYLGLRLLPDLSDIPPASSDVVRGVVVGSAEALRILPPQGLVGIDVAKVGFIGRAPLECELEAQLVRMRGDVVAGPAGPPGRVVVPRSDRISTIWVDLPPGDAVNGPLAISLRALRGRFFWAGADRPLVRLVARDPDPGGRPLRLASATFLAVNAPSIDVGEQVFPPALFRSAIPAFSSELFLSLDISDLILRYRRP